jgi:hypothetical protein
MRLISCGVVLVCLVLQIQARVAPTVSGIAVAGQYTYGAYNATGKIMKYIITNGVTVSSSVLYAGPARYATLSSDGKKAAFFKNNKTIAVMSISGGTAEEVLPATSPDALINDAGCLDWPTGDWLYFNKSSQKNSTGSRGIWKVNVVTRQVVKICTFDQDVWLFQTALDGKKFIIRTENQNPWYEEINKFQLSDNSINNNISLASGSSTGVNKGCGTCISPSGTYWSRLNDPSHKLIVFHPWDGPFVDAGYKRFSLGTLSSWADSPFINTDSTIGAVGGGMNNNRWSCNSEKWVCVQSGIDSRGSERGGNQVLFNWVDSQVVRTSQARWAAAASEQNENGDFWVSDGSTTAASVPLISASVANTTQSVRYALIGKEGRASDRYSHNAKIWDLKGRLCSVKNTRSRLPAVYIMEK